ncbi:MAG: hypothetical protein Q9N68_05310 [Gammaproteobacteria bacterium]|nr:hypothetical protein [Gammaproteobacteria bacterium]
MNKTVSKSAIGIGRLIAVVILLLTAINGIFTYAGAHLYVDDERYALLFAVAVQFAIAISLIALPYVQGVGKLVLMLVYLAGFSLSTVSAYTYVYNAGLQDLSDKTHLGVGIKAEVADSLSRVVQLEQQQMNLARQKMARLQRQMAEESERGYSSQLGPGKGPEYYRKLEEYQAFEVRVTEQEDQFERFFAYYDQLNTLLMNNDDSQRDQTLLLLGRLQSSAADQESVRLLSELNRDQIAALKNPVEKAISSMMSRSEHDIQWGVSLIWAAIFDLLALFLGIVRYYLIRPRYALLSRIYDGLASFFLFLGRLFRLGSDTRLRLKRERELHAHDEPMNQAQMQSFATYIMAGSQASMAEGDDVRQPLRNLFAFIEPLNLLNNPKGVGIRFESLGQKPELKTLMALLIQSEVFITQADENCYVLNAGSEMVHKLLLFVQMGLKDDAPLNQLGAALLQPQLALVKP